MDRWFLVVVFMAMVLLVVPVGAQEPKSEPAWCGGSWSPGAVDGDGKTVEAGGTSLGSCMPIMQKVDGKDVSVPTHPAYPSHLVIFQQDAKGVWAAGTMQSEKGSDDKVTQKFVPIPPRVVAGKK